MTRQKERHIQLISGVLFFLYLAALIYFLFFSENYGRSPGVEMRYNLVPFAEIRRFLQNRDILGMKAVFLNVYGNVIGFIPFGLFLPMLHRHFRKLPRTVLICMLFSTGVELTQLVTRRGSCDIDDVILNTLGGLLGYIAFRICNAVRKKISEDVYRPGGRYY